MNAELAPSDIQPSDQTKESYIIATIGILDQTDQLGIGCCHLHPPSPFISSRLTQPEGWYLFYNPTEGRRLSRHRLLATVARWFNDLPACRQSVAHPSTNRAWRRVTTLTEINALPISHATTLINTSHRR